MRRTGFFIGAGVLVAAVATIGSAGPVSAGLQSRPDLHVRAPGGSFVGNDVYNEDGADQTVTGGADFGETVRFRVRVQNDGNIPAVFRLRATPSAPGTRMRYFVSGQDASKPMKHDGFFTVPIGPGDRIGVRVEATITDDQIDTDTFFVRGDTTIEGGNGFDVVLIEVDANPT